MNGTHFFPLALIAFMASVAIAIFITNLVRRQPRPMMAETSVLLPFFSVPGVFAFLGGMWLLFYDAEKYQSLALPLVGIGLFAVACSIILNALTAKAKRAAWPVVSARCIKQTLQRHQIYRGDDYWLWTLVCEVNYAGKKYQVEPKVRWSDAGQSEASFGSEVKAQKFLSEIISPNGACKIRVNPKNPLEAELLKSETPRKNCRAFLCSGAL